MHDDLMIARNADASGVVANWEKQCARGQTSI